MKKDNCIHCECHWDNRKENKCTAERHQYFIKTTKRLCSENDCFKEVEDDIIEKSATGKIYEPSLKCWNCRTDQDRKKIKRFRKVHNKKRLIIGL